VALNLDVKALRRELSNCLEHRLLAAKVEDRASFYATSLEHNLFGLSLP
jgi:hypothetical protein